MGIETVATGTVTGLLAFVFFYTLRRTKDVDERRDEASDLRIAGLETELVRLHKRCADEVIHYERIIGEQRAEHIRRETMLNTRIQQLEGTR